MKTQTALLLVLVAAALVATVDATFKLQSSKLTHAHAKRSAELAPPPASNDYCKLCVAFSADALNELLNLILNAGVIGGCSDLCNALEEKTGKPILGAVCDILCDVVGIQLFIDLINKADLDPIYFCQELKICPINDNADAKVVSFVSVPKRGPRGSTFTLQLVYSSQNGTGTGELVIDLQTVDGIPLGDGFLMQASGPGLYNSSISVNAKPDPSCDPTQQPCEQWLPGQYTATMQLCNGQCGSKHPHTKTLFTTTVSFNVTA